MDKANTKSLTMSDQLPGWEDWNCEAQSPSMLTKLRRTLFPVGYFREMRELLVLATPIMLVQLTQFTIGPVALIFCGRLGKTELAAAALAISVINITGVSVGFGLSTSCDTIFSQLYGSPNRRNLGTALQRSLLFNGLCAFPCIALMINGEKILLAIGQDPAVSRMAAEYLSCFSPGVVFYNVYVVLSKYLQCQNIVLPNMIIGLIASVFNALSHYISVIVLRYGLVGSAVSQALSYLVFLALTVGYVLARRVHADHWEGWSPQCLLDWPTTVWLSVCGMLMTCASWASYEVSIFLAGILGTTELGTQSILFQTENIFCMLPLALGVAASVRVGQALGAGAGRRAQSICGVALTATVVSAVCVCLIQGLLRSYIPVVFTNVPEVIDMASKVIVLMSVYETFEAIALLGAGIVRGSGRQNIGAAIMSATAINLVVSVPLMFKTDLGIFAFWYCFSAAVFVEAVLFLFVVFGSDWDKLVEQTKTRVGEVGVLASLSMSFDVRRTPLAVGKTQCELSQISQREEKLPLLSGHVTQNKKERDLAQFSLAISVIFGFIIVLVVGVLCRVLIPMESSDDYVHYPTSNYTYISDNTTLANVGMIS